MRPVGLKGELKIKPLTDNPERYRAGAKIWAEPGGREGASAAPVRLTVKAARESGRDIAVFFEEIDSIEDAEAMRGREFFVPESDVPPLPEGEYYHFQILGLPVFASRGRLLGKVSDIIEAGGRDVYVVKGQGGEYLIPVTDEAIEKIDPGNGRITLRPMKGYIPE